MKSSTNSKAGSAHWFNTLIGRHLRVGEYLMKQTPTEEILREWGTDLYQTSKELVEGLPLINTESESEQWELQFDEKRNGAVIRVNGDNGCKLRICRIPKELIFDENGEVREFIDIMFPE